MLLVAGCSFLHNPFLTPMLFDNRAFDPKKIKNVARSGAGNAYIAHSILENLTNDIDRVFVLFSGLSRIDVPLPVDLEFEIEKFSHRERLGQSVWYFSGGATGFWNMDDSGTPDWLRQYLKHQYITHDWQYLANLSLTHVAGCLAVLESRNINYRWGFIHDIYKDHSHETSLGGAVSPDNALAFQLPWHRALTQPPYDFCRNFELLSADGFHPSESGYRTWADAVSPELADLLTNL